MDVRDAPVINVTEEEMLSLSRLFATDRVTKLVQEYGLLRIDPPPGWKPPLLRMQSNSRFYVRHQTLPAPPFVTNTRASRREEPPLKRARLQHSKEPSVIIIDTDDDIKPTPNETPASTPKDVPVPSATNPAQPPLPIEQLPSKSPDSNRKESIDVDLAFDRLPPIPRKPLASRDGQTRDASKSPSTRKALNTARTERTFDVKNPPAVPSDVALASVPTMKSPAPMAFAAPPSSTTPPLSTVPPSSTTCASFTIPATSTAPASFIVPMTSSVPAASNLPATFTARMEPAAPTASAAPATSMAPMASSVPVVASAVSTTESKISPRQDMDIQHVATAVTTRRTPAVPTSSFASAPHVVNPAVTTMLTAADAKQSFKQPAVSVPLQSALTMPPAPVSASRPTASGNTCLDAGPRPMDGITTLPKETLPVPPGPSQLGRRLDINIPMQSLPSSDAFQARVPRAQLHSSRGVGAEAPHSCNVQESPNKPSRAEADMLVSLSEPNPELSNTKTPAAMNTWTPVISTQPPAQILATDAAKRGLGGHGIPELPIQAVDTRAPPNASISSPVVQSSGSTAPASATHQATPLHLRRSSLDDHKTPSPANLIVGSRGLSRSSFSPPNGGALESPSPRLPDLSGFSPQGKSQATSLGASSLWGMSSPDQPSQFRRESDGSITIPPTSSSPDSCPLVTPTPLQSKDVTIPELNNASMPPALLANKVVSITAPSTGNKFALNSILNDDTSILPSASHMPQTSPSTTQPHHAHPVFELCNKAPGLAPSPSPRTNRLPPPNPSPSPGALVRPSPPFPIGMVHQSAMPNTPCQTTADQSPNGPSALQVTRKQQPTERGDIVFRVNEPGEPLVVAPSLPSVKPVSSPPANVCENSVQPTNESVLERLCGKSVSHSESPVKSESKPATKTEEKAELMAISQGSNVDLPNGSCPKEIPGKDGNVKDETMAGDVSGSASKLQSTEPCAETILAATTAAASAAKTQYLANGFAAEPVLSQNAPPQTSVADRMDTSEALHVGMHSLRSATQQAAAAASQETSAMDVEDLNGTPSPSGQCVKVKNKGEIEIVKVSSDEDLILIEPQPATKNGSASNRKRDRKSVKRKRALASIGGQFPSLDQDKDGKLTQPIVFPDSTTPVSFKTYKREAGNSEKIFQDLPLPTRPPGKKLDESDDDLKNRIDILEAEFWHAVSNGVNGKRVSVAYGVDVEMDIGSYNDLQNIKKSELEELKKRAKSDRACTVSHVGNLNRDGVLRHLPIMPGINHTMFYVGQLFTRFCWHVEDAFLNSVSYLHEGSAEKVWYGVPPADALKFEEYASKNVFSPDLLRRYPHEVLLMNKTTIFSPQELVKRDIKVCRVIHKPGSFVLTAPRAYHAGFNCGFNIAEAVNFANPKWIPVGREASLISRKLQRPLCVPWEYLVFHEAKRLVSMEKPCIADGSNPKEKVRSYQDSSDAGILAEELRCIIKTGERSIREHAEKLNCRVAMVRDVVAILGESELSPEFGNGAGIVCSVCGHACHFYALVCGGCRTNGEARCVDHFGTKRKLCFNKGHRPIIVRRHEPVLLLDMLDQLEERAGICTSDAEKVKRYKEYVRPWDTPLRKGTGLVLKLNLTEAASRPPFEEEPIDFRAARQAYMARERHARRNIDSRKDRKRKDKDRERKDRKRKALKQEVEWLEIEPSGGKHRRKDGGRMDRRGEARRRMS